MDFQKITDRLGRIPARILLGKFRFPEKRSGVYSDPNYMPFFYYLGSELKPKHVATFKPELGIRTACCVIGNREAKVSLFGNVSSFVDTNVRLAGVKPNIGNLTESFDEKWDLVLVRNMDYLELIWNKVNHGGFICMLGQKQEFHDFCKCKNREPVIFKIRDGIILIER